MHQTTAFVLSIGRLMLDMINEEQDEVEKRRKKMRRTKKDEKDEKDEAKALTAVISWQAKFINFSAKKRGWLN